jgi:hypothetical protein
MKKEPVAIIAAVAAVLVGVAAHFNVVLDTGTVETFALDGLIIVTAIIQRQKVSPV